MERFGNESSGSLEALEQLAHWDALTAGELAELERQPEHSRRLERLRRTDAWLKRRVTAIDSDPCPSAETLYDYGRGPGYRPLEMDERGRIDSHLEDCVACETLVETLATSPPLPLDLVDPDLPLAPVHELSAKQAPASRALPLRAARLLPLAAAGVAIGLFIFQQERVSNASGWPAAPLLRGAANEALLFPRGLVLFAPDGEGFAGDPLFEMSPIAGAAEYRVTVRAHSGGAFERGAETLRLRGAEPALSAETTFALGHYTWEAWAVVDGLEQPLGSRDFEVIEDRELLATVRTLPGLEALHTLHTKGYRTDARHIARRMPSSKERDDYLGTRPGR